MELRAALTKYRAKALETWNRLSQREIVFISAAASVIALFLIINVVSWTYNSFQEQSAELAQVNRDLEQLEKRLGHYVRLQARKKRIEEQYQKADLQEGGLGYLDELIKKKLGLANVDFDLSDAPGQPLGAEHEQVPFRMTFRKISSLEKLVDFLTELTRGPRPFIVTSLNIQKRGPVLDVDVGASAVRRIRE